MAVIPTANLSLETSQKGVTTGRQAVRSLVAAI